MSGDDSALEALEDLAETLDEGAQDLGRMSDRAHRLVEAHRAGGGRWSRTVAGERRPLLVEELGKLLTRLDGSAGRFRRLEALALRGEGLTQERIAQLFGVSRQRVAVLLAGRRA